MALVNMKQSKAEAKETLLCGNASDGPKYPYGLTLNLDEAVLKKLGIVDLPDVGEQVTVMAYATVVNVSAYQSQDQGSHASASLQITDMEVSRPNADKSTANRLFGKST